VKAVILKVDSPGGEVMASDQINRAVADFQEKSGKPVVARWGAWPRAGGLLHFRAVPLDRAGSTDPDWQHGVIMEGLNYRGLMDKIGLARWSIKAEVQGHVGGMRATMKFPPASRRWCRV